MIEKIPTPAATVPPIEPLLTVDQIAKAIGKSNRYVIKLIHVGTLRGIRFSAHSWRVEPDEYRRFLKAARESGSVDGHRHTRTAGGARKPKQFTIKPMTLKKESTHEVQSKTYPVGEEG
jgi:excisionase family DNA binding protein